MVLPLTKASELGEEVDRPRWLVEDIWLDEAVGVIGGEPKACKTFMALELAVAVSSGRPFLRHYAVENPGLVLLYAAEDKPRAIRKRLSVIAGASGIDLADCSIQVITVPSLKIDDDYHRTELTDTVKTIKPRLLILDPFIRLHRKDENAAGEIGPLLAYLRALQKVSGASVVVVHHARKRAGRERTGQSLRGSSEFHAWYDSCLYLTRTSKTTLRFDLEHRSEESQEGLRVNIVPKDDSLVLEIAPTTTEKEATATAVDERIVEFLRSSDSPQSLNAIRDFCRVRKASVIEKLAELAASGILAKQANGYLLTQ